MREREEREGRKLYIHPWSNTSINKCEDRKYDCSRKRIKMPRKLQKSNQKQTQRHHNTNHHRIERNKHWTTHCENQHLQPRFPLPPIRKRHLTYTKKLLWSSRFKLWSSKKKKKKVKSTHHSRTKQWAKTGPFPFFPFLESKLWNRSGL